MIDKTVRVSSYEIIEFLECDCYGVTVPGVDMDCSGGEGIQVIQGHVRGAWCPLSVQVLDALERLAWAGALIRWMQGNAFDEITCARN